MPALTRLSMSLEAPLAARLDRLMKAAGAGNRSEFIRDLIRTALVRNEWADSRREVVGVITLVYDHHVRQLTDRLMDIQHDHHDEILATTHVHVSHDRCAEMIMIRGRAGRVRRLVDLIRVQKGVLHCDLSLSSTGAALR